MSDRAAPPGETEEGIQQAIIEALRWKGFDVRQTTHRHRKCRNCGEYSSVGYGADKGIADLQVWIPPMDGPGAAGAWLWLEVKRPGGKMSPEQQQAEREGKLIVVRSVEDALAAVGG